MSERSVSEQINEAYRAGFVEGVASLRKEQAETIKIRSAGFRWKMQSVFLENSKELCECENRQAAIDFHEMMFARVIVPANDLYIANVWGKALSDVRSGEVQ